MVVGYGRQAARSTLHLKLKTGDHSIVISSVTLDRIAIFIGEGGVDAQCRLGGVVLGDQGIEPGRRRSALRNDDCGAIWQEVSTSDPQAGVASCYGERTFTEQEVWYCIAIGIDITDG